MRIAVALSAIMVSACGAGQQRCSTNGFIYRDSRCDAPFPDGGGSCVEVGTGDCYARCTMDTQCSAEAPFCRLLGLYNPKSGDKKRFPILPAYDQVLKCSNLFNTLDARGAISVTERVGVIQRVRKMAVAVAAAWVDQQSAMAAEVAQ